MRALTLTALGFVSGIAFCVMPEAVADKPGVEKRDYADTRCRGNGPGGYRKCRVDFERPARKVAVDVYIGGQFDIGFIWQPDPESPEGGRWEKVAR